MAEQRNFESLVSVVICNFNGAETLPDTIEAARGSLHPHLEILVVDDGSTDNSLALVASRFPDVKLVPIGHNTRRLNIVRNTGIRAATSDWVMLIDNDISLAPDVIPTLLRELRSGEFNATASARILYENEQEDTRVYWDGGELHYLGLSVCQNRNAPPNTPSRAPERNVGCGNLLLDRRKLEKVGYFDEEYFLGWGDDGEIYYRLLATGFECLHVSSVSVMHISKYRTSARLAAQLRNRWMFVWKNYQWRTIILMAPPALLFEIAQMAFCVLKGNGGIYFRAMLTSLAEFPSWLKSRKTLNRQRRRGDRAILVSGPIYISPAAQMGKGVVSRALAAFQAIFNGYWRLTSPLLQGSEIAGQMDTSAR